MHRAVPVFDMPHAIIDRDMEKKICFTIMTVLYITRFGDMVFMEKSHFAKRDLCAPSL